MNNNNSSLHNNGFVKFGESGMNLEATTALTTGSTMGLPTYNINRSTNE